MPEDFQKDLKTFGITTLMVVASRVCLFLLAYGGLVLLQDKNPGFWSSFQGLWDRWDSNHYLFIAEHGYQATEEKARLIVFGPLFPLLTNCAYWITKNYFLAGVLVSNLSLIASGFFLYKLVALDYDDATAVRSVKYMLIYPFSFFLGVTFSESLYLAFFLMAIYSFRRGKWIYSGLSGMCSVLARPGVGIFLILIFLLEYAADPEVHRMVREKRWDIWRNDFGKKSLLPLGACAGIFLYLFLNRAVLGDWLVFLTYQKKFWFNYFRLFPVSIKSQLKMIPHYSPSSNLTLWIPQLGSFFGAVLLGLLTLRRLRFSYLFYSFAYLFLVYSNNWLLSGARYLSVLFPLFIMLGILSRNKVADFVLTLASSMLLTFYTLAFTRGSYLM